MAATGQNRRRSNRLHRHQCGKRNPLPLPGARRGHVLQPERKQPGPGDAEGNAGAGHLPGEGARIHRNRPPGPPRGHLSAGRVEPGCRRAQNGPCGRQHMGKVAGIDGRDPDRIQIRPGQLGPG